METIKTKGLVLRQVKYGDYDTILTVLTEEYGVVSAVAKGARGSKSKNGASLALLTYSEIVLQKGKGELLYIKESETLEGFFTLRYDVVRLSAGVYFADFASRILPGEGTGVLRLLLNTLYFLANSKQSVDTLRCIFELRLLSLAGFAPSFKGCALCQGQETIGFEPSVGGMVCASCSKGRDFKIVDNKTAKALHLIQTAPLKSVFEMNVPKEIIKEALICLEKFIKVQISYEFQTLNYLKTLQNL